MVTVSPKDRNYLCSMLKGAEFWVILHLVNGHGTIFPALQSLCREQKYFFFEIWVIQKGKTNLVGVA